MIRLTTILFLNVSSILFLQGCSPGTGLNSLTESVPTKGTLSESLRTPSGTTAQSLVGNWGGIGINFSASQNSATLNFDCAHGEINHPINLDTEGNFDVDGIYFHQYGGPTLDDASETTTNGELVRYQGSINEKNMTLRIVFDHRSQIPMDSAETNGFSSADSNGADLQELTFNLTLNANSKIYRCL